MHNSIHDPIVPANRNDEPIVARDGAPTDRRPGAAPILTIEIADAPTEALQSTEHAEQLIRQYVQELRTEIAVGVDIIPPAPSGRRLMWGVGLGVVATSVLLCLLVWSQTQMLTAAGQAAALQAAEQCAGRQTAVMDAVAHYTRDHGEAPPDLASLAKTYLDVPASDPSTGEPYKYAREGAVSWLTCARHPLPPVLDAPEPVFPVPAQVVVDAPVVAAASADFGNESATNPRVEPGVDVASPERLLPPE